MKTGNEMCSVTPDTHVGLTRLRQICYKLMVVQLNARKILFFFLSPELVRNCPPVQLVPTLGSCNKSKMYVYVQRLWSDIRTSQLRQINIKNRSSSIAFDLPVIYRISVHVQRAHKHRNFSSISFFLSFFIFHSSSPCFSSSSIWMRDIWWSLLLFYY